jgi:hypothetical protein
MHATYALKYLRTQYSPTKYNKLPCELRLHKSDFDVILYIWLACCWHASKPKHLATDFVPLFFAASLRCCVTNTSRYLTHVQATII